MTKRGDDHEPGTARLIGQVETPTPGPRWPRVWGEIVHEELFGSDVVTFRLSVVGGGGTQWGQAISVEQSRLDTFPSLYGITLDRMVRDISKRVD